MSDEEDLDAFFHQVEEAARVAKVTTEAEQNQVKDEGRDIGNDLVHSQQLPTESSIGHDETIGLSSKLDDDEIGSRPSKRIRIEQDVIEGGGRGEMFQSSVPTLSVDKKVVQDESSSFATDAAAAATEPSSPAVVNTVVVSKKATTKISAPPIHHHGDRKSVV
jgi:hypothetical protein